MNGIQYSLSFSCKNIKLRIPTLIEYCISMHCRYNSDLRRIGNSIGEPVTFNGETKLCITYIVALGVQLGLTFQPVQLARVAP